MGVLRDLLHAAAGAPPLVASAVVAGPRFTALVGAAAPAAPATAAGVAYTGAGEIDASYDAVAATRALESESLGRPLLDLAGQVVAGRQDLGAAALNALLGVQLRAAGSRLGDENGLDLLAQQCAGRRLAVVGQFPYLKTIRVEAAQSWVLELRPDGDELPAAAAPEIIPQADVVGITGSTLANGTLQGLLDLCRPDAFVVLIGPTAPLSPVLFDYGVDVICGAVADDPLATLQALSAEASTRRVPGMKQVSLRR